MLAFHFLLLAGVELFSQRFILVTQYCIIRSCNHTNINIAFAVFTVGIILYYRTPENPATPKI